MALGAKAAHKRVKGFLLSIPKSKWRGMKNPL